MPANGAATEIPCRLHLPQAAAARNSPCVLKGSLTERIQMEVDLIFKIAAVGILVAVLNILLTRSGRDEQALMVTLAGLVCVLVIVLREISELFRLVRELFGL